MATAVGRMSVTDYEQQRNARLDENRKRMEALGLLNLSRSLAETNVSDACQARKKGRGRGGCSITTAAVDPASLPRRRSSRLVGTAPPSYNESHVNKEKPEVIDGRQREPEIYTEEDEKLLGNCEEDWELFVDGFRPDGTRIYDPHNGKTCHQCRQKTLGLRTTCSQCHSLRGQFCGDCLFMRYGENVRETVKNDKWVCPVCRGICNCSFCRIRKGWAPTGSMYRLALKLNYKSVAHYLIMTRRENPVEGGENTQASKLLDNEKVRGADDCLKHEAPESGKCEQEEDECDIDVVIDRDNNHVKELSLDKDSHQDDVKETEGLNAQSSDLSNTDTNGSEITTDEAKPVEDADDSKPIKRRGRPKGSAKKVKPEAKQSEFRSETPGIEVTDENNKPVDDVLESKPARRPGRPKGSHTKNETVSKSGKKRGQNVRTPVPTRRSLRSKSTEKCKTESGDAEELDEMEEQPIKMKTLDMEVVEGCEEEDAGDDNVSDSIDDSLCPRRSLKYMPNDLIISD